MMLNRSSASFVPAFPLGGLRRAFVYDVTAPAPPYDGLSAFAPLWSIATLFSLAGDAKGLTGERGWPLMILTWAAAAASIFLLVKPRTTWLLVFVAAAAIALYVFRLPVASNNKTISAFMNAGILLALFMTWRSGLRGEDLRRTAYEQLRMIARGLLLTMYFYGIFHKINTDFLDPRVSCAVGLYEPLARPFGLGDNLWGKYLAIYSTFVVEAIAIIGLLWPRYFAVGLIGALVFHFIIPISAYSWYMDFSSLVLALYMLTMPMSASQEVYAKAIEILRPLRIRLGRLGALVPGALLILLGAGAAWAMSLTYPSRAPMLFYHSIWIMVWAVIGGVGMVAMTAAALIHLPYEGPKTPSRPAWVYLVPIALFLSCLSPYLGLKTESSINMFSNLHTEGGVSNHLLAPRPPYLFGYQRDVVMIKGASDPGIQHLADTGQGMVLFAVKEHLRRHPDQWISFARDGQPTTRATAATFEGQHANILERNLLLFKAVDFQRPKPCTH